ncbi:methyl-accepting chemotaxis protein [Deinococcus cellulosilyticus]|uniref:Methyl-accepting chemotaxis protein n=1 Tax=Deinococcus cellulosilyticus (strain DSM 18568 / NBRC 106333 / KACC 11606 / 5516J-15) TaxID=1223518 RepID=A0A511MUV7_DEIC1|nr:methyl-accepting chemotaxis protein [Deinococcus cellulosilyticus]GEM44383.1 hypothetical protein DC3_00180 [Deinococcus cellulosilyticus NBRC 106333 = KACC 11606]
MQSFKTWSVFNKITVLGLLCVVVVMVLVGWLLTQQTRSAFIEQGKKNIQQVAFNGMDKLDRSLFERYTDVQSFAATPAAKSMNPSTITELANASVSLYAPIYSLIVVADASGRIIAVNTVDPQGNTSTRTARLLGQNVSGQAWFKNALSSSVQTTPVDLQDLHPDPLVRAVYGPEDDLALSFSAPIRNDAGRVVGVWSNRIDWDTVVQLLKDLETAGHQAGLKSLRVGLVDTKGLTLHSPQDTDFQTNKLITRMGVNASESTEGAKDAPSPLGEGAGLVGWHTSRGYSNFPGFGWVMLAGQDLTDLDASSQSLIQTVVLACVVVIVVFMVLLYLIRLAIERRVRTLAAAANALAVGNLSVTLPEYSRDEIGALRNAFERMTNHQSAMAKVANSIASGNIGLNLTPQGDQDMLGNAFQRMLDHLRSLVKEVQEASHNLASASMQLQAASAQQGASINEQSAAVTETSATVEEVRVSSDQAVDMANTVSENAQTAQQVAVAGSEATQTMIRDMQDIRKQVQDISSHILTLSESSQKISDIIEVVSDLADQSNLLALNAAIEAHRAGEHGRGFVIVAQEIRNLAEQSKTATSQVRTILSGIQRDTNAAVMATERGTRVVDNGAHSIQTLEHTINELSEAIEHAARSAQVIAGSVKQHSYGMEQIALAMQNIQTASEQNLQASESNQQAAKHLSSWATRLKNVIDRYRLEP